MIIDYGAYNGYKWTAQAVKEARLNAGLSQGQVCKELGYLYKGHGQFISNIERGKSALPLHKVMDFCEVTNFDHKRLRQALIDDFVTRLDTAIEISRLENEDR